jgi:hypothetical protein
MKIKAKDQSSKAGGIFVMVMMVMLVFISLSAGLFKLKDTNAVESVQLDHTKQAFWHAETGLQDALQRLSLDSAFEASVRGSTATYTASDGSYQVTVTDNGSGSILLGQYSYDIVSMGLKGNQNRRIRQVVDSSPGPGGPITGGGDIKIGQNTTVGPGPITALPGATIEIDDKIPPGQNDSYDFDHIVLADGASINEKQSGATEGEHYAIVDMPPPNLPDMYDASADRTVAFALATNSATGVSLGDIALGGVGTTQYYNVPNGITINTITGSGRIVNTGPITITPKSNINDVDVVADVDIISFEYVNIGQKNDFAGDATVYAESWIYFGDSSIALAKSALYADGHDASGMGITMGGHSQFEGQIFADEGDIIIQQGSNGSETRIEGAVASGAGIDLGQNTEIVYNPDFTDGGNNTVVVTSNWKEIAPL